MSDPTTSAIREACDAVRHGVTGPGEIPYCSWPRCGCELSDAVLDTLLANARAEGAAGEREAIAVAFDAKAAMAKEVFDRIGIESPDTARYHAEHFPHAKRVAAAIRARDAKEASGG